MKQSRSVDLETEKNSLTNEPSHWQQGKQKTRRNRGEEEVGHELYAENRGNVLPEQRRDFKTLNSHREYLETAMENTKSDSHRGTYDGRREKTIKRAWTSKSKILSRKRKEKSNGCTY